MLFALGPARIEGDRFVVALVVVEDDLEHP
jgi:hypothetical protein